MVERPERLMSGLDVPRGLPPGLRARLEAELIDDGARAVRPELADALADSLTDNDDLLSGIDGPRTVPGPVRAALEAGLVQEEIPASRWRPRTPWLAGAAAACLLAAVVGASTLGHGPHARPTTAPTITSPPVAAPTTRATSGREPAPEGSATASALGSTSQGGAAPSAASVTPQVTSVEPNGGTVAGGETVKIRGLGLTNVRSVRFGGAPATSFRIVSSQEIDAIAPAHAVGPVDVMVTADAQTSPAGPADRFTYRS